MYQNSFDFLRLTFAILVILTHSYALTGMGETDWLSQHTNNQVFFSFIGLSGFFSLSGYLIFQSLQRSKSVMEYLKKRVCRIFPGLVTALLICIIVGAIVTNYPLKQYLSSPDIYKFFFTKLFLFASTKETILDVFEQNPYPRAINGSLWTIPYEFLFYLMLLLVFRIKTNRQKTFKIFLAVFSCCYIMYQILSYKQKIILIPFSSITLLYSSYYGSFFIAGSLLSIIHINRWKKKLLVSTGIFSLIILSLIFNVFDYTKLLLLPVFFIIVGEMRLPFVNNLAKKIGDLSYGIYIYAFLIQQTLMHYYQFNYLELTIATIPIAFLLGYMSWHLIEKPFLQKK